MIIDKNRVLTTQPPAEKFLRRKAFYYDVRLPAEFAASPELFRELSKRFRLLAAFALFLDECLIPKSGAA